MKIKHIGKVSTQRYKNLDLDQGLRLSEGLNIFIGSNGSGKSNFLGLLRFLSSSLSGIFTPEKNNATNFTKAVADLSKSGMLNVGFTYPEKVNLSFNFVTEDDFHHENQELSLWLSILCSDKKLPQIVDESFYNFANQLYYYKFRQSIGIGTVLTDITEDSEQSRYTKMTEIQDDEIGLSILPKLLETTKNSSDIERIYLVRRKIINLVSDWRFYSANNMNLKEIRNAEPEIGSPEKYLNPDCENLALVLDNLIQESIDFEDQLNVIMRDIVPQTKRIRPIRTGRTRISIEWHLHNTKRPLYLDEMSDGTVRMLCWAIILNSPNLPSLIVIDEPEVGLHVQWLSYLAEWIKNAAARTQVIITTHSPDLLDKFTDRLENVHVFEASNPEQTLFHAKTLSRERLQDRLDEGWELGDLYRVGEPEVGGWAL
ncbi:AAA family ATPase [Pseudanabaena sp. ABRG5-3]|uniref:AAA family ATPase n=1 Tax=Pseudanabaena sp. ABRG5-3 TaxID=685565 RepID=UPI000DC6F1AF|nr:AAA family ATPase [Pseudanabaena sp. ABRG5-3]BBC26437.1 ATPase-like protein [Pseudanabaena sp. ABRG5-3]